MTRLPRLSAVWVALALAATLLPASASGAPLTPVPSNLGCDPLDERSCLLPFPNDLFTRPDPSSESGRRVDLSPLAMPRSGSEVTQGGEGKPVDPMEWNRNDGFSPGTMVMASVPGIDLHKTWGTTDRPHAGEPNEPGYFDHRDHIADIGLYRRADAPLVIVNAETGERHPFWSEVDAHPGTDDPIDSVLIMRPAINFEEGARYVVALRDLKDAEGNEIPADEAFVAFRSGEGGEARQEHFDSAIFPVLEEAGIERDDLSLAWDFTIASERNLAERILHMRDDSFGRILGDGDLADGIVEGSSPDFTVDRIELRTDSWTDSRGVQRSQALRRVHGRVTVPNYLDRIQQTEGHVRGNELPYDPPVPGSRLLDLDLDGLPDQNPVESTVNVPYVCEIPLNGRENNTTLYGHGLLGTRSQVGDIKSPRRNGPFLGCAADWWGMSTPDAPTIAAIIADLSNFPSLPDRAQQGFLNFMFLGRAAVHPDGFATDPAFQQDGAPLVKVADDQSTPLYYDGNSQGGIMGGSLVAVSPDIQRGILGVPGMNYSTLLNRSIDWEDLYAIPFYEIYRDPVERQILFSLMQMLWDRGEANGYAAHMTDDPLPNTPPHEIMLQVAYSDHQVANVAAEVEARTIGAPIMVPGLPEGRHWEMDPYFSDTASYPYQGSALVYWDSGNATPPNGNVPPTHASDPHSHPRNEPASSWQEAEFLLSGWMLDVCQGGDYLTLRHPQNEGRASCLEPDAEPGSGPGVDPATALSFTEGSATSGQFSDEVTFEAELTDADGAPITGADVVFELSGSEPGRTFDATTNEDGLASATTALVEEPGDYTLSVTFLGDDERDSSAASTAFTVLREDTALALDRTGRGSRMTLVATLTDEDSGAGVAKRIVEFRADGEVIGTADTDGAGRAELSVPARYRSGRHEFEAAFAGDDHYRPSSATQAE